MRDSQLANFIDFVLPILEPLEGVWVVFGKLVLQAFQWSIIGAFMLPFEPSNLAWKTCPQTGFWVLPENQVMGKISIFRCLTFEGVFSQFKNLKWLYLCLLERSTQDLSSGMP